MILEKMNEETYSQHWERESKQLDTQGIYTALAMETPVENVLEIGCGSGVQTSLLASLRKVLSIDSNHYLVGLATDYLNSKGVAVKVIQADLFSLSEKDVSEIRDFAPKGIVCWFIGSYPDVVEEHTPPHLPITERPKAYRERIEDLLLTENICQSSVDWIHLANRVGVMSSASERDIIEATKDDYNAHVFSKNGFEVTNVKIIDWDRNGSDFMYVHSHNPNLRPGNPVPRVISILAKRINLR